MIKPSWIAIAITAFAAFAGASCNSPSAGFDDCTTIVMPSSPADPTANHDTMQTALSTASPGDIVCFAAGTYPLVDQLVLATPNVEMRGSQAGRTVFDFAGQLRGPNGVSEIGDGFVMQHITVKNSSAAAIRIQQSTGITLRDVTVTWDNGAAATNGGYGIYPTECTDVLMDHCTVSYAEDAGVYIGQSHNVVIHDTEAFGNTVGIEIENTMIAEAYSNDMHDNVAGLFLSNLPNLPNHGNGQLDIHDNRIEHNNATSFAAPGSAVSAVPAGAGIMVLATTDTDIHDNTVQNNESFGVGVFSYAIAGRNDYLSDATYDEYPARAYIHGNHFQDNGLMPQDAASTLATLAHITKVEDIVWDGELAPATTAATICLSDNGSATYRNIDYAHFTAGTNTDISAVTCVGTTIDPLAAFAVPPVAAPVPAQAHDTLSAYGFFTGDLKAQVPAAGVVPYDVVVSLFADGADKLRFMVLPAGGKIAFDPTGRWTFPDGTTFIKTFFYPTDPTNPAAGRTLIETRLETLIAGTWTLQSYLWDDAQTEATRDVAGKTLSIASVGHDYRVPSSAECHICHLSNNATMPLGPRTWQLNVGTQLDQWSTAGYFATPPPAAATLAHLSDPAGSDTLDLRARSYLEANCAHCHAAGGTADATGLRLGFDITDQIALGVCRSPVSAGPGSGPLFYDVVPGQPSQSIVTFRMSSTVPDIKMPQLPTTTSDGDGTALVASWITSLSGGPCPAQ